MMQWIEQVAVCWWHWVFHASWQLAILIVIVAIISSLLRSRSALLHHSLWLVVLAKAMLPPYIRLNAESFPWLASVLPQAIVFDAPVPRQLGQAMSVGATTSTLTADVASETLSPLVVCLAVWLVGIGLFWWMVVRGYRKISRSLRDVETLDEGSLRIAYEKIAMELGMANCPDLRVTNLWTSPFLVGVRRPSVVIPEAIVRNASAKDIDIVMAHELVHHQRRDTLVGWVQVIALSFFWFHPFFWWAMRQIRQSREEACDEAVLQQTSILSEDYGDAMLKLVTRAQANSPKGVGLVGVFESSSQIQIRLEKIMKFKKSETNFGLESRLVVALASLALLPMVLLQSSEAQENTKSQTKIPQIVSTEPIVGAVDVEASRAEIRVTFDRDMSAGMSWTGGPPYFPPGSDAKARWIDKRTCVLPVKLERGKYYRVGLNSKSYTNFKSTDGVAFEPYSIYFTTEGASAELIALAKTPEVVRMEPANGAIDVDPKLEWLSVTFNMPMGKGMSWTGGGVEFPKAAEGKQPSWSEDNRTCKIPVALESGRTYRLGLNSPRHKNFQSSGGVALEPVQYSFQTK